MTLTQTQKFLLKYAKSPDSSFEWKDIVKAGLGEIYHENMKLGNVHRIVYDCFNEFFVMREFQIPCCAPYEVLTSVAQDFDYRFRGLDTPKTVSEVLQNQLTKMLTFIMLTHVGHLPTNWRD